MQTKNDQNDWDPHDYIKVSNAQTKKKKEVNNSYLCNFMSVLCYWNEDRVFHQDYQTAPK